MPNHWQMVIEAYITSDVRRTTQNIAAIKQKISKGILGILLFHINNNNTYFQDLFIPNNL